MAPLLSWAIAQVVKTILSFILTKKFNPERLIGSGGMPSCHSATVIGLMYSTAYCCGIEGFEFPLATTLAIIVMYDAMGVRRETGIQAKVINDMLKVFEDMGRPELSAYDKLKEFIGHTPLQVTAGAILGILIGMLMQLAV